MTSGEMKPKQRLSWDSQPRWLRLPIVDRLGSSTVVLSLTMSGEVDLLDQQHEPNEDVSHVTK